MFFVFYSQRSCFLENILNFNEQALDQNLEGKPIEYDATGRMIKPRSPDKTLAPVPQRKPASDLSEETKIPQYETDPVFERFRENLKPREGGIADRSKSADPGGLTNQGMSQATLDLIRKKHPEWNLPKSSRDLTEKQITGLFRDQFYEYTQINKLNEVAGYNKTGSKLVEHIFDANIMTTPTVVGEWLQESIDETIGSDLRIEKNGIKEHDGILGSQTRAALKQAVEQGKTKEISRKFWNKRLEYLKEQKIASNNRGWWPRLYEFKE